VIIAIVVHSVTLGFAVLGIVLLIRGWPRVFSIIGSLICVGIVWFLRPRFPKMPDGILPRDEFPALYAFVDRLAAALGAPEIHSIAVNYSFNATITQVQWRRKYVLSLGLPLWEILGDQEKVALVSHELAHQVNGDPARGLLIGTAIMTLVNWYDLLRPEYHWMRIGPWMRFFAEITQYAMSLLAYMVWAGAYVLNLLLWRDTQRAEYLADQLAATISGTDAQLSLLEKLSFRNTFETTLRKIALGDSRDRDLFEELLQNVERMPERERERIRRVLQMEESRIDVSHPPTAYRIALLRAKYVPNPGMVLSASESEQIDSVLAPMRDRIQRKAITAYKASLY
jgi:heat shock protein HtpX